MCLLLGKCPEIRDGPRIDVWKRQSDDAYKTTYLCWIPAPIVGDAMEIIVVDLEASNFVINFPRKLQDTPD